MSKTLIAGATFTGIALLAPGLVAQSFATTPVLNVNQEGNSASPLFVYTSPTRIQTIYEAGLVYRPLPQWSTLALRPDDGFAQSRSFDAFTRTLTIHLGSQGVPSPELASRSSFSANHGSDYTEVLTSKPVSFPAFQPNGAGPAPFTVTIPLDRPFSLGANYGHLLVEIDGMASGQPVSPYWMADAEYWNDHGWTVIADTFGSGCGGPHSYSATFDSNLSRLRTEFRFPRPMGSIASHFAVAWLGTNTQSWGGLPLPAPLALLGAPGCAIYTEPAVSFFGTTSGGSSESFTLELQVPRNYTLLGKRLYSQSMVFDPNANNVAGVRVSEAGRFLFSTPPSPLQALTLFSVGTIDDTPQSGLPDQALVLGVQ